MVGIVLLPQALPEWKSASFFSASLVESPEEVNLLQLFVPDNIFRALSNGLVPAVVVFSIAVGVAVMKLEGEGKTRLLSLLGTLTKALAGVNLFVLRLYPFGCFCHRRSHVGDDASGAVWPHSGLRDSADVDRVAAGFSGPAGIGGLCDRVQLP